MSNLADSLCQTGPGRRPQKNHITFHACADVCENFFNRTGWPCGLDKLRSNVVFSTWTGNVNRLKNQKTVECYNQLTLALRPGHVLGCG